MMIIVLMILLMETHCNTSEQEEQCHLTLSISHCAQHAMMIIEAVRIAEYIA